MAHPARSAAGFTLVELLIGLVLSSIVVTVIFGFLSGQSRFAQLQTAREEVQQNARGALELIAADLRAVGPGAISAAAPDSIVFASPRAWGLVCGYPGGKANKRVAVIFPTDALPALRDDPDPEKRRDFLAIPPAGSNTRWQFLDVQDQTRDALSATHGACSPLAPDPALSGPSWTASRARLFAEVTDSLPPGTSVYVYDPVKYNIGTSNAPGRWIRRRFGSAMQAVAGPVPARGGLAFRYFKPDGTDITAALQTNSILLDSIGRVGVTVTTESSTAINNARQRDSASTVVYLRNLR